MAHPAAVETRQRCGGLGEPAKTYWRTADPFFPKPRRKPLIMFGSPGSVGTATIESCSCNLSASFGDLGRLRQRAVEEGLLAAQDGDGDCGDNGSARNLGIVRL